MMRLDPLRTKTSWRLSMYSWHASAVLHALVAGTLAVSGVSTPARLYPPRHGQNSPGSAGGGQVVIEEVTEDSTEVVAVPVMHIVPPRPEVAAQVLSSDDWKPRKDSPPTAQSVEGPVLPAADLVSATVDLPPHTSPHREEVTANLTDISEPQTLNPPRHSAPGGPGTSPYASVPSRASSGQLADVPSAIYNPPPIYPREALAAFWEGRVVLRVAVNAAGRVTSATVLQSSGHPILDEAARRTLLEQWRFEPARRFGFAVATEVRVPIVFQIERD